MKLIVALFVATLLCYDFIAAQVEVVRLPSCREIFEFHPRRTYAYIISYVKLGDPTAVKRHFVTFDSVLIFCDLTNGLYEFCIRTMRNDCVASVFNCTTFVVTGVPQKEPNEKPEE